MIPTAYLAMSDAIMKASKKAAWSTYSLLPVVHERPLEVKKQSTHTFDIRPGSSPVANGAQCSKESPCDRTQTTQSSQSRCRCVARRRTLSVGA